MADKQIVPIDHSGCLSLYDVSIPTFLRGQHTLKHLLVTATKHAQVNDISLNEIPHWTLHPDMKPLTFQVQCASNTPKKFVDIITGQTGVAFADDETTIEQLIERCQHTIDFLNKVDKKTVDEAHLRFNTINLQLLAQVYNMTPQHYVTKFAVPNFFFHLQTAYAIFRMKGVSIGKVDYLERFLQRDG
ncbi:hypothetical protein GE21DRAFT_10375 [Neurospora crassa]|uniref:DUF1993 domain-containing protein n=4 Tax=Neurospora TaxID=5140 RepID=Q7S4T5_NEUCR|nr:uncharacterized protein NEUTE1DRAFT_103047 [Neurospora tetrasperma FGSC 2508]XP_959755.1 hypothetical protein NCU02329 [Neurospora crassa OR74A]EGZ69121.1 hypothetical protein NEUTE2DRAFT_70969 [Neurospora tetrasperma FGSC 2509]KAK3486570.1 hypothetical protein B0T23DRAFT_387914 [Neurospora hispaniola]KAK3487190.1 hypothetical protein B0T13DRAFT_118323 [Neurospora crassa]EAA30519.1 hypothetical protein NCU02329 [Neurospora crassa OR74A]EGO55634.1 hypothetical protein NEUTE1DRAFT_103047 [Ne|eukprot:XP_959755.1 hypothetical protein NCU02329 [Neurospora crassa OR74A]